MKWSEEETLKFAELYRDSECLWNLASPTYKNKNIRQRAMENLVKDMEKEGFGLHEAKQKIKNLRSTFNQELLKIKKSAKSGAGTSDVYIPTVKWFPVLEPIMKLGKGTAETTDNLNNPLVGDETKLQAEYDDDQTELQVPQAPEQESAVPRPKLSEVKPVTKSRGQKRRIHELSHVVKDLKSVSDMLAQQNDDTECDEIEIFGKYVSKTLKKLTTHDSICAQQEIQGILTKYRLGSVRSPSVATDLSFASTHQSSSSNHEYEGTVLFDPTTNEAGLLTLATFVTDAATM